MPRLEASIITTGFLNFHSLNERMNHFLKGPSSEYPPVQSKFQCEFQRGRHHHLSELGKLVRGMFYFLRVESGLEIEVSSGVHGGVRFLQGTTVGGRDNAEILTGLVLSQGLSPWLALDMSRAYRLSPAPPSGNLRVQPSCFLPLSKAVSQPFPGGQSPRERKKMTLQSPWRSWRCFGC